MSRVFKESYTDEELKVLYNEADYVRLTAFEKSFLHEYAKNGGNGCNAMRKVNPDLNVNTAKVRAHTILNGIEKNPDDLWLARAYLGYLKELRSNAYSLDAQDLLSKGLKLFDMAVADGKVDSGTKVLEVMAKIMGLVGKNGGSTQPTTGGGKSSGEAGRSGESEELSEEEKQIVEAFKESGVNPSNFN